MAAKPGDVSDPGLVLVVAGLTVFVPKKPMKPGMFVGTETTTPATAEKPGPKPGAKHAPGTPARLRLSPDKTTLPDDDTEVRLAVTLLDAAGQAHRQRWHQGHGDGGCRQGPVSHRGHFRLRYPQRWRLGGVSLLRPG